jgi:FkbM family methyltransferase
MNSLSVSLKLAKLRYIWFRIWLRVKKGKNKRNEFLRTNGITFIDFLPEKPYSVDGVTAIPRKGTNDYFMFFVPRELAIKSHLYLDENETFVDVGSNIGSYTIRIASKARKGAKVIAIEAHPGNYWALIRNIKVNNLKNITALNKAVSDHKGIVSINEARDKNNRIRPECYTMFDKFHDNPNGIQVSGKCMDVECDTLDNILQGLKVDLMKIDIEGAEVQALEEAKSVITKVRKVIVEVHGDNYDKVKELLAFYGLKTETVREYADTFIIGSR